MMRKFVSSLMLVAALATSAYSAQVRAQAAETVEPFKVGTFAVNDTPFVGLVVRNDTFIVDLDAANRAMQLQWRYSDMDMPEDMLGLIEQYEYGLKFRIYEVVNWLVEENLLGGDGPDYVHPVAAVDIMAPIQYPSKIMNAAVNFYSHACEGCTAEQLAARTRERQVNRGVPYLFLKPTRGAVIGHGKTSSCRSAATRSNTKWRWPSSSARPANTSRPAAPTTTYSATWSPWMSPTAAAVRRAGYGVTSDWFVGKGHDTFAPHGPWIVPREFYGDPMERLHQVTVIDGVTVQEARAGDMIHNIPELIEYASSLITVFPGDVLQSGTSGGTGAGRVERATGSGYLVDGENISASIEGIGTLTHRVVAERDIPADLSGSQLPPTASYRDR